MAASRFFTLNTGARIPAVGLGTWQAKPNEVGNAVKCALEAGYRHLDCAYVYENEKEIGAAIKDFLAGNPTVKRGDLFITSKLWNTFHSNVAEGLNHTLSNLGVEYLDLYLMHWPLAFAPNTAGDLTPKTADGTIDLATNVKIIDTWRAMEKLHDEGRVKAIGVSNFTVSALEDLLRQCRIRPAVNQVELHPYLSQDELLEYCAREGIHLTAYSPLGSVRGKDALHECPTVKALAQKYNATTAQVLISWGVARGTSVIPKSSNPDRVKSNFNVIDLTKEDMESIKPLGKQKMRVCDPARFWDIDLFGTTTSTAKM